MTDAIAASALTTEELPLLFANEQLLLSLVVPLKPPPDLPEEQKDTSHSCMYIINKYIIVVLYCICIMLCTWEDTAMVDTGKLLKQTHQAWRKERGKQSRWEKERRRADVVT